MGLAVGLAVSLVGVEVGFVGAEEGVSDGRGESFFSRRSLPMRLWMALVVAPGGGRGVLGVLLRGDVGEVGWGWQGRRCLCRAERIWRAVKERGAVIQGKKYKATQDSPSNIPANPSTSISLAFVFISCNSN